MKLHLPAPLPLLCHLPALAATPAVTPAKSSTKPDSILLDTMQAELTRAMASLGTTAQPSSSASSAPAPAAPPAGMPSGPLDGALATLPQPSPKPYFVSFSVADADQFSLSAAFGAITSSRSGRVRNADVEVRLGSPAEDNTHGDHRNSALSTIPMPLTDDRAAIARSLWFATNRGYARALDAYLKVKTEQQVRAREEDVSADFSRETPATTVLPASPPLDVTDKVRSAWADRIREISGIFKQYPDVLFSNVALEASTETDYFVSSEGSHVATPSHVARLIVVARTRAADGMDLFVPRLRGRQPSPICPIRRPSPTRPSPWRRTSKRSAPRPSPSPSTAPPSSPPRLRRLLPRGPRPSPRRPATARRRRRPDLHQAPRQTHPAHLPLRRRRHTLSHLRGPSAQRPLQASTTKASPRVASISSKMASSKPSSCRASPSLLLEPRTATPRGVRSHAHRPPGQPHRHQHQDGFR